MRSQDAKVAKRASIIHGLHLGHRPDELAKLHHVSLTTIYNYFNRFKAEGSEGLGDKARNGRTPPA